MEPWANVFTFFVTLWWSGLTFALVFHFSIYYISAKYASGFDGKDN